MQPSTPEGTGLKIGLLVLLASGCSSDPDPVDSLQAISVHPDPSTGYAEGVEKPIETSLELLVQIGVPVPSYVVRWCNELVTTAKVAKNDPSRVVRCEALKALGRLTAPYHAGFEYKTEPVKFIEVARALEPLVALADGDPVSVRTVMVDQRRLLLKCMDTLDSFYPEDLDLAFEVIRIGTEAYPALEGDPLTPRLNSGLRKLGMHAAFQVGMDAARLPIPVTQGPAVRLAVSLDAGAASRELLADYPLLGEVTVKVSLLKALYSSDVLPLELDPDFRLLLGRDLDQGESAVEFWATKSLARCLDLDLREVSRDEVRAAWEALGSLESPATENAN